MFTSSLALVICDPFDLSHVPPLCFRLSCDVHLLCCFAYVSFLSVSTWTLTCVPLWSTSYQTPSFSLFAIHDKPFFVFEYLSLYSLTSGLILLYSYFTSTLLNLDLNPDSGFTCLTESPWDSAFSVPLLQSSLELFNLWTSHFVLRPLRPFQ